MSHAVNVINDKEKFRMAWYVDYKYEHRLLEKRA